MTVAHVTLHIFATYAPMLYSLSRRVLVSRIVSSLLHLRTSVVEGVDVEGDVEGR